MWIDLPFLPPPSPISLTRLRELMAYDPDTGVFTRRIRVSNRCKVGEVCGCLSGTGHRQIIVDKKTIYAHRLAWFYIYEKWPEKFIDHINGDPDDNRISNLRECTTSQNAANSKSNKLGLKGAYFYRGKKSGKKRWRAKILVNGKRHELGAFTTEQEAHSAYRKAAIAFFGEFARFE